MTIPLRCGRCGEVLRPDDVDPARETAKCRACRYKGPFVGGQRIPSLTEEELAQPPDGIHLKRSIGSGLTVVCRPQKKPVWFFLSSVAALAAYGAALAGGTRLTQEGLDWSHAGIWLGAGAGMAGLAGSLLYFLAGRTEITIRSGQVRVVTGVLGFGRIRKLALGADTRVQLETSDHRERNIPQLEVVVTTAGKTMAFGAKTMALEAKKYVAAVLRRAAGGRPG